MFYQLIRLHVNMLTLTYGYLCKSTKLEYDFTLMHLDVKALVYHSQEVK